MNPFYSWLLGRSRSKWFFLISVILIITLSVTPLALEFLDNLVGGILNQDIILHYSEINIALNMLVTIAAILFIVPYYRHFDSSRFLERLDQEVRKDGLFECLNLDREQIIKRARMAFKIHRALSKRIIIFYFLIVSGYVSILLKQYVSSALAINVLEFLKVMLNNVVILVLLSMYYSLTFYNKRKLWNSKLFNAIIYSLLSFSIIHAFGLVVDITLINSIAHAMSGVAAGVAFALLIGKFGGAIINTPTSILSLMFMYAVVQSMFVLLSFKDFSMYEENIIFITYPCLILKCVMFIYFYWLIRQNRIAMHLIVSPSVDRQLTIDLPRMEKVFEETHGHEVLGDIIRRRTKVKHLKP